MSRTKKKIELGTKEYPYCSNRECIDFECLRHRNYIPWNVLSWQEKYIPNDKGVCKDKIKEI